MGTGSSLLKVPAVVNDPRSKALITAAQENLTDEQLIKLVNQMEYHIGLKLEDPFTVCENLIKVAACTSSGRKVPTVRFGKTGIDMPIVTCGGMRLQQTWMPDNLPISPKKINKKCQNNLVECVRMSLALGINHFETARFYGTSELQFVDAICEMIENGEIKREDIIVQTKVTPAKTNDEFRKTFDSSWKNMSKIGYIDLFSFHGLNNGKQYDWVFQEGGNYTVAEELLEEGKIKHVGFSTHGTPDLIRKTIETDKMEYVNLHYHYFGSYHSSFYEDGEGGHGNAFNVQLAKSKDMGVFIISPVDKGGALYSPTRSVVNAVYPLSPIGFQSLWLWEKGCDTISIGISKPSDFDEVVYAALQWKKEETSDIVTKAETNLDDIYHRAMGSFADFWRGVPTMWEERSQGIAVSHIVWLWGLVKAYGMVEFAKNRYKSMEKENAKWKNKKDTLTNIGNFSFNPGRHWEPKVDYDIVLGDNKHKDLIVERMEETHHWLNSKDGILKIAQAYTFVTWESYPGDDVTVPSVIAQNLTGGLIGAGGGKSLKNRKMSSQMRSFFQEERKE